MNGEILFYQEAVFFFQRDVSFHYVFYPDKAAAVEAGEEQGNGFGVALGFHFHGSVPTVLYPACKAEALGQIHGAVAEADALHPSGKNKMSSDSFHTLYFLLIFVTVIRQ